uniref:Chitin-binding type-2 domain-containing protein n=1 Tax=Timema shepardi TaxID=629360 RepID=A0A7R9B073_TIMSH|nr:unnamed protein product [Timema shepardi]
MQMATRAHTTPARTNRREIHCYALIRCGPCSHLLENAPLKSLVKEPLQKFENALEDLRVHASTQYHIFAAEKVVFAVLALFVLAVSAEDKVLTDEQISALTQEAANLITDEEWINIFTPRCTPTSTYYWSSQYLSDIRDCHHFYECVGFKPVRMECAANLHWNSKLNTCDYPANAGCIWYSPAVPAPKPGIDFYPVPFLNKQ